MPTKVPICFNCKYYTGQYKCLAFTEKIPEDILYGEKDHSKPLPEQNNDIVFEAIEEDGQ